LVLQVAGESQRYIEGKGNIINCLGAHKKHSSPSSSSMDSSIHSPLMMMMIPLSSFLFTAVSARHSKLSPINFFQDQKLCQHRIPIPFLYPFIFLCQWKIRRPEGQ
jgi:hypothetical protein